MTNRSSLASTDFRLSVPAYTAPSFESESLYLKKLTPPRRLTRDASAVPTWTPRPSVPALMPMPNPGSALGTGRGRNCATPSSPSSARAKFENDSANAAAQRITENRRIRYLRKNGDALECIGRFCAVRQTGAALFSNHVRGRPLVLSADEFDELAIRHDTLRQTHGERRGIRLRIVNRDVDTQRSVIESREAFGQLRLICKGRTIYVKPPAVAEVVGFDDERVAVPVAGGVAVPERVDVAVFRQRPAVGEDFADAFVALVENDNLVGRLNHLPRLRMNVELHQAHRQAVRVGIVSRVRCLPLLVEVARPRLEREAVLEPGADFRERRLRRLAGGRRRRLADAAVVEPEVFVDPAEIDRAVSRAWRRRVEVHLAVGGLRNFPAGAVRPLRPHG